MQSAAGNAQAVGAPVVDQMVKVGGVLTAVLAAVGAIMAKVGAGGRWRRRVDAEARSNKAGLVDLRTHVDEQLAAVRAEMRDAGDRGERALQQLEQRMSGRFDAQDMMLRALVAARGGGSHG